MTRLRHTEQQFRQASILASIDTDSVQLFTFYKKVDVVKDQRTILTKFGQILRSNSCTISYKAAARAPDLLKAENSRIYRLFISAILAGIDVSAEDGREIIPLGPRYHAMRTVDSIADFAEQDTDQWWLLRTDLQMILSGQIIVTISEQRKLVSMASSYDQPAQLPSSQGCEQTIPVVLAPTGQLAIYSAGWMGQVSDPGVVPNGLSARLRALLHVWQGFFADWALRDSLPDTQLDDLWVELSIPVQEQISADRPESPTSPKKPDGRPMMGFKSLFWPAKWCFAFDVAGGLPDNNNINKTVEPNYDPVQEILEWFETMRDGDLGLNGSKSRNSSADNDDVSVFPEDSAFDHAETFQPFGPPTFPASQTVYPTPPDVVMTHATPAMSSVDGLAATPATMARSMVEVNSNRQDQAADTEAGIPVDVGSGLYDEDLFDDMPGDAFGQTNTGDEPNWDFFDKPTNEEETADPMDIDPPIVSTESGSKGMIDDADDTEEHQGQQQNIRSLSGLDQVGTDHPIDAPGAVEIPHGMPPHGMPHSSHADDARGRENKTLTTVRRRSSVFDSVERPVASPRRDQRYTAAGSFYFDAQGTSRKALPTPHDLTGWIRRSRSPSVSSDSEHSGYETPIDADSPLDFKIQTPGQLPEESVLITADPDGQIVTREIEQDARVVFDLVSAPLTRATLDEAIVFGKPVGLGPQFDKPTVRNGFAHEIVNQITQTSLLRDMYGTSALRLDGGSRNSVALLGGTVMESALSTTVSNLCALSNPSSAKRPLGRTTRLFEPEITMKRLNKPMTARPAILPFWDTLGLQPHPRPKDVTAFCLHPYGPGMADSCLDFLARVSDAYVSCNLGQHSTGHLTGVTSNGLLEADAGDQGMYLGPVRRLGEALAKPTQSGGTLVIYLIASSDRDMAYVYCSVASYAVRRHVEQGWAKRSEQLNLVFQIIPPSFVASPHEVVVPSQNEYNVLALGVYSRIPPFEIGTSLGICEYPLVLPEGKEGVNFDLEVSVISPLSRHGARLHLCYAFSDDRRWLVATWTDQKGYLAFALPYQIKSSVLSPARPIDDIIKDMWAVSQELMSKQRNKWRLLVSRIGTVEALEASSWTALNNAQVGSSSTRCSLFLLSIELKPTFRIFPQAEPARGGQFAYGTPASTPQGGVTSPEQVVAATPTPGSALNAPTPPEHGFDPNADIDLSLTDPREESWTVILPYGVNQSRDSCEARPAAASGYLVKRLGTREEDGITMLGVHMVWPTSNPAAPQGQREDEIEDCLSDFRGLITLAAARGCIDRGTSCVPWHIHTAVSGATALGRLI